MLIRRHEVVAAGSSKARAGVKVVTEAARDTVDIAHLVVDRGYSAAKVQHFAAPIEALGIDRTHDLMPWQRSPQPDFRGYLHQDGGLFCKLMPEALRQLPPIATGMPAAARDKLIALFDERAQYSSVVQQGRSTGDGHIRVGCPARRGGKVRCPLVESSLRRAMKLPTIEVPGGADGAPGDCCTQATIQVPATVGLRERQKYLYGTSTWWESKSSRQSAENANSLLKIHRGRAGRNYIRCFGRLNQQLLLTFSLVAVNLLSCVAYRSKHGLADPEDIVDTERTARRAKRRKGTLAEILAPKSQT
jgi:hypothetical protein